MSLNTKKYPRKGERGTCVGVRFLVDDALVMAKINILRYLHIVGGTEDSTAVHTFVAI